MLSQPSPTLLSAPNPGRTFGPTTPARTLLAAVALLGGLFAGVTTAFSQSVATVPVGAMTYDFPANSTSSVGIPLLRDSVLTSVITETSGSILTVNTNNVGASILPNISHYIEIIGHSDNTTTSNVGERFEINELATITASNNTLSIDLGSNLNTATGDLSSLIGYRIAIRPHWTLGAIFGTGSSAPLISATSFAQADQILAWDGSSWSLFWFRQNSAGTVREWRNLSTGTQNQDNAILPPGVGIYFRRKSLPMEITLVGDVRTNKFIRNLDNTTQLIASGYPIDFSPSDLNLLPAKGYTAATSFASADQILAWSGTAYELYWLRKNSAGNIIQWRNISTGATDYTTTSFISANQSYFIRPTGTPNDLIQEVPFQL